MKPFNFKKWLGLLPLAAYGVALGLLTLAERQVPGASIQTFGDALWYSLVTMSTVGYGDLYPITSFGKILGMIFILLSLGMFTFLVTLLIRIVTGDILPAVQLWMARKKTWYIFSCQNSAAYALAQNLSCQDPEALLLFPQCSDRIPPGQLPHLIYTGSLEALAAKKKDRCHICFMDDDDPYQQAVAALQSGFPVYCRTTFAPDICPENLTLFDPYDSCAQCYWQDHGLSPNTDTIVLIGDGKYAQSLLTQGLLLNVFSPERKTNYHVYGNWQNYLRNHQQLGITLCLDGSDSQMDQLHFHTTPWNEDVALLNAAPRIILCQDQMGDNMEILGQIHRYFPVTGQIHVLCPSDLPGHIVFGTRDSIYTPQLVLQEQLRQAARAMHQIYCNSAGGNAPSWENLTEFQRQSNIAAANHLLTKIRILLEDDSISAITAEYCRTAYHRYCSYSPEQKDICRRIEHQRWMRFYSMYNWRHSPQRNNVTREHPLMLPYDALPYQEQEKDDYAWELLGALAEQLS